MAWTVELSEEVAAWYRRLAPTDRATADRILQRLADLGNDLRMPHSRALGEGQYELRFVCKGTARRITYIFEPRRHALTLTTFRKQRQNERAEILRARRAQARRAAETTRTTETDHPTSRKDHR